MLPNGERKEAVQILILDDNPTSLKLLTSLTEKIPGCVPVPFDSPDKALSAMPRLDIEVAVLDYQMPVYNGVEFLTEMMRFEKYASVPTIFITGDLDMATRMTVLNAGAVDFITKPVDATEFRMRLQNVVALAGARRDLTDKIELLRAEIDRGMLELREREREIIHRLTMASGYKDSDQASHALRVAAYAEAIGKAYGLSAEDCNDLRLAAPLHDAMGSASTSTDLLKRGKLTEADFRQTLRKTLGGADMSVGGQASLLQLASEIAQSHRERWDGEGSPERLKGEQIPVVARIVAIADNFDTLTSARPFKEPMPVDKAVLHIRARAGRHFDPACVDAFEQALPEIRAIMDGKAPHEEDMARAS